MARASLLLAASVALALAAPAAAYLCLNGDPCLSSPCYAGQICTTLPSSRRTGTCIAVCSTPSPQPPFVQPYQSGGGGNGCVNCATANPCVAANCPAGASCIADPCRCTWSCSALAPPAPNPTPKPAPPPAPAPPPLPNGGCPANLPYTPCYSDPCQYAGLSCPNGSFCQASNCGACRALCVRPMLADPAPASEGGLAKAIAPAADAFGPAIVPPLTPAEETVAAKTAPNAKP